MTISAAALGALVGAEGAEVIVERVMERGILTEDPEGAVEIRLSSSVNRGNVVFSD